MECAEIGLLEARPQEKSMPVQPGMDFSSIFLPCLILTGCRYQPNDLNLLTALG